MAGRFLELYDISTLPEKYLLLRKNDAFLMKLEPL